MLLNGIVCQGKVVRHRTCCLNLHFMLRHQLGVALRKKLMICTVKQDPAEWWQEHEEPFLSSLRRRKELSKRSNGFHSSQASEAGDDRVSSRKIPLTKPSQRFLHGMRPSFGLCCEKKWFSLMKIKPLMTIPSQNIPLFSFQQNS